MAKNNVKVQSNTTEPEIPKKHVPFAVVEAYKTIRTNLSFVLTSNSSNVITITSPNAGEGKSTTAVNTAIAFSQLGNKVLIIDADMRRATLHKKLKLENNVGLSNVLAGFVTVEEAVKSVNESFDVITAGQIPPNPSELLGSEKFKEFLAEVSAKYSYVIIDTPPINVVSDTMLIAPHTAGLVFVVRDRFTYNDAVRRAIAAAEFANINILGAILNDVDTKNNRRYNYYRKYGYKKRRSYKYGYGGYGGYGYGGYGYGGYGYGNYGYSYGPTPAPEQKQAEK